MEQRFTEQEMLNNCCDKSAWNKEYFISFEWLPINAQAQIIDTLYAAGMYELFDSARAQCLGLDPVMPKPYVNVQAGKIKPQNNLYDCRMKSFADVEEREVDWLIDGFLPRRQIILLAGDGGSGKGFTWCNIAAAVSTGKPSFLEDRSEGFTANPERVAVLSSEDPADVVLHKRLREAGADLSMIEHIDLADERQLECKIGSDFFKGLIQVNCPSLLVIDPLQAFLPADLHMSERNAMRHTMASLAQLCETTGTTALIIMHTNKRQGAWGRNRLADSSDLWDLARSVLIAGTTADGMRYLSHEKNNYGIQQKTILFQIENGLIVPKGTTEKRDRDFVTEQNHDRRQQPAREEAKQCIMNNLRAAKEAMLVSDLEELCHAEGIKDATLRRAKQDLKREDQIKIYSIGFGNAKRFYIEAK